MNVTNKFPEIYIFLADNGFVTVLEKLAMPLMPAVETDRISGQQPTHKCGQFNITGSKQKMCVVWKQCPGITGNIGFRDKFADPFKKVVPVLIIPEYILSFDPPDHHMMHNTGGIQSG